MGNFINQNKGEMRRQVGRNINAVVIGTNKTTGNTVTLIDTYGLRGGDDEHNGKEIIIYDAAGSIVDGEKSRVSNYAGSTSTLTVSPAFSANITALDKYELWDDWLDVVTVDGFINQAIRNIADPIINKVTEDTFTWPNVYEYACLTNFIALYMVEYASKAGIQVDIDLCETAWDELVDADVVVTETSGIFGSGSKEIKLAVAAGCGAGDILATQDISSKDLSACDKVEISIYSTVALDAGDIQLLLDNTASCASPVETLDIPATSANTKTRHILTLANPLSDTAAISVGLKMVVDKGAFSLYAQKITAVLANSRIYKELNPRQWEIVHEASPKLKLTESGFSFIGTGLLLRLSGYKLPSELTDDTTDCEIDPDYVINQVSAELLLSHSNDPAKRERVAFYASLAEEAKSRMKTNLMPDTKW